ncbi:phosphotransferase [Kitasatospora sp. NPDC004669]|uniref:phosphotransferase family protein n=1 Tax=Kitasatospora sp. NPDC004669 TaxID=3154555 RepID=UPI0033A6CA87
MVVAERTTGLAAWPQLATTSEVANAKQPAATRNVTFMSQNPVTYRRFPGEQRWHEVPLPPFEVRRVDTTEAFRRSIAEITALPKDDLAFLERRLDALEDAQSDVRYVLPPGLLQGDPHHRNALHHGGSAVLCDWDTACVGQPQLDLVTVEIHCRRFDYGLSHYQEFADRYGFDVTSWQGYPVLSGLRELRMITTNVRRASAGSPTLAEVRRRIEGLQSGHVQLGWNIL